MFRLNQKHREIFSNKILDVANIAAGALIFGQFISGKRFSWYLTGFSLGILFICYFLSYFLLKKEG
ncbi:MAG: hypothetical protein COS67_12815 [Deltaproteobacteria bacterium CG06_land_8_20_14_3_00_44_19]|nr:MAG: hypothetical protein COS67_12815 [Deltaproteobacteria bacterium CG06_land_8_20_14_3_00_44_19]